MHHTDPVADTINRGTRFAAISAKFPHVANVIATRNGLTADHYKQWYSLDDDELKQLDFFFNTHPHIKKYVSSKPNHPTYTELLIIINQQLSLEIFTLENLAILVEKLSPEANDFLRLTMLIEESRLLDKLIAVDSVKSLLLCQPQTVTELLSFNKDFLIDLNRTFANNTHYTNINDSLTRFSKHCIDNKLQPTVDIPVYQKKSLDQQPTEPEEPEAQIENINAEIIQRLEKYIERIRTPKITDSDGKSRIDFGNGFNYFIAWQSKGREANYNQAVQWLAKLTDTQTIHDEGTRLAVTFDPVESKRTRTPARWCDFFTGITSDELSKIQQDVMQHIKITTPLIKIKL